MVGDPTSDFLKPHQAAALHWHLTRGWGIENPRISLLVDMSQTPARSLVVERSHEELPGNPEMTDHVVGMLPWYLPPGRSIALRPDWMKVEDMKPISDYMPASH